MLKLSSLTSVLRGGTCVAANCNVNGTTTTATASIVPGLGVCLSELVSVSGSSAPIPFPTIMGLNSPAAINTGRRLAWWEILLMVLGCILIFLCILALFRKCMRAKRAKRTTEFPAAKNIDARGAGWREKLSSFFSRGTRIPKEDKVALSVARLRNREEERHMAALNKLGLSPEALGSSHYARSDLVRGGGSEADTESLYSQVTGVPPRGPVTRKPVNMRNIVERGPSQSSRIGNDG